MDSQGATIIPTTVHDTSPRLSDKQTAAPRVNGILSCCMYSACSVSMVILNKCISYGLEPEVRERLPDLSIVLYQCLIAVVLVELARAMKIVEYPAFNVETAISWVPLNLLFIGMLSSGFIALTYVSVPMITVTKNLTNLITVAGDYYLFGESFTSTVFISILLMTLGAIMAGANDLEFSLIGYCWVAVNCLCTSSYTLYMRYASTSIKLPRFGMIFYNNLLSAVILFPICMLRQEFKALYDTEMMTPYFIICNTLAGLIGFYLNFASLWCVSATSATTYAIVGSLNKVPITVLGFLMFNAKMTNEGIMFVVLATAGGFLYGYVKLPKQK